MEQLDERIENETTVTPDEVSEILPKEQTPETVISERPVTEEAVEPSQVEEQTETEEIAEPVVTTPVVATPVAVTPVETTPVEMLIAKKPANKKKVITIIGIAVAAIAVVMAILFFVVIRPNSIYKEACEALDKQNFVECQKLLDKIPNHENADVLERRLNLAIAKNYIETGELDLADGILATMPGDPKAQELKGDVIYKRAVNAVAHEKYEDAQEYMEKIPEHSDPEQVQSKLTYQKALQCVEEGDYETGYELMSSLGDYEDAAEQKEIMYYEALAFVSLLDVQNTLKNPASLRVSKIAFRKSENNPNELYAVHEITASNSYGGTVGGYVYHSEIYNDLKQGENTAGMIDFSTYNDPDTDLEYLEWYLVYLIKGYAEFECSTDVARMNRLLENKVTFKINLDFQSGETVEH